MTLNGEEYENASNVGEAVSGKDVEAGWLS